MAVAVAAVVAVTEGVAAAGAAAVTATAAATTGAGAFGGSATPQPLRARLLPAVLQFLRRGPFLWGAAYWGYLYYYGGYGYLYYAAPAYYAPPVYDSGAMSAPQTDLGPLADESGAQGANAPAARPAVLNYRLGEGLFPKVQSASKAGSHPAAYQNPQRQQNPQSRNKKASTSAMARVRLNGGNARQMRRP